MNPHHFSRFLLSSMVSLFALTHAQAAPVITEFMAANKAGLADGDGAFPDWIEIHNPKDAPVNLAGHILSDADGEWVFPVGIMIEANDYVVVFASGRGAEEPAQDTAGHWHTSFKLNRSGESLTLTSPTGEVLSAFAEIPEQRTDVSFGTASNDSVGYFEDPTPGADNGRVLLGYVSDTKFSADRGYQHEPIEVTIAVEPSDATILYTTDGTDPDEGTVFTGPQGEVYEGPLSFSSTTVLKAIAFKKGWEPSNVDAQTYIFLDDVLQQSDTPPEGYPDKWGGVAADYGMDPDVVLDPAYQADFTDAFNAFPTLSIAMDRDDLFANKGIYQNTTMEGPDWERSTSVEFIFPNDAGESFQVPCGIRIQGGSSRQTDIPKHSFSLRFREEYGLGELNYPIYKDAPFGENALDSFDYLQLRSGFNFAWTHRHYYQSRHAQYNRDQFVNDLYLAMGHPGIHGRWFHLYLNGLYWGMYHAHERPDSNFMAAHFGGAKADYDAVNSGQATDGDLVSWNAMWSAARNADNPDGYAELLEHLEVDAFIDYMLINYYVGNWDWDGHNWRAAGRHGTEAPGQWFFFPWDSEFAISPNGAGAINNPEPIENSLTIDRTRTGGGANRPTGLHAILIKSPIYKRRLEDRIWKHFNHGGVFTPERATQIWKARSDVMDRAIIAESARWGDYKRDVVPGRWPKADYDLYTKNDYYLPNQKFILERYLPERPDIVLDQLKSAKMLGNAEAPIFTVGGEPQHGGILPTGETIQLSGKANLFYTIDGMSDPVDADARAYDKATGIDLKQSGIVRARSRSIFGQWSPLIEAFFIVGQPATSADLLITEIHYHPAAPTAEEKAAGFALRSNFEFIELANVGSSAVNVVGVSFINGIDHTFATDEVLAPQERVILVANREAFTLRYPQAVGKIAGVFSGSLRNSGERLALEAANGEIISQVRYNDREPWPTTADGDGPSLVLATLEPQPLFEDGSIWQASQTAGGTPGLPEEPSSEPETLDYNEWLSQVFTADQLDEPAMSAPLADVDADGRATLLEYALGSSPVATDTSSILTISSNEDQVEVAWSQRIGLRGASLRLEVSSDLLAWATADASKEAVPLNDSLLRVTSSIDQSESTRYLRLAVQLD